MLFLYWQASSSVGLAQSNRVSVLKSKLVYLGLAANHCPPDYPWPLNDYDHCCKHFWSGLDDNQVLTPKNGIDSCPEGDIVKCPIGKCRTNPHTEGNVA